MNHPLTPLYANEYSQALLSLLNPLLSNTCLGSPTATQAPSQATLQPAPPPQPNQRTAIAYSAKHQLGFGQTFAPSVSHPSDKRSPYLMEPRSFPSQRNVEAAMA